MVNRSFHLISTFGGVAAKIRKIHLSGNFGGEAAIFFSFSHLINNFGGEAAQIDALQKFIQFAIHLISNFRATSEPFSLN